MDKQMSLGFAIDDNGIDRLDELHELVTDYKVLQKEIDAKEQELSALKLSFNKVSQDKIPDLLQSNGLSEIRLNTGEKVTVKEDLSVTIESKEAFHDWLAKRGDDSIVKLNFYFDQMPIEKQKKLVGFLFDNGYTYASEYKVHWQTQKAYFKRLLGTGQSDWVEGLNKGKYIAVHELPRWAKVFPYHKTTIK